MRSVLEAQRNKSARRACHLPNRFLHGRRQREVRGDQWSLLAGVEADPSRYLERTVTLDMLECSESGVWLLDTETGLVWSLHQFARC